MTGTSGNGDRNSGWLRIERRGAAVVVTLERREALNALSIGMRAELASALTRLGPDPMVYAVVLRSAVPNVFSVGGDVREMTGLCRTDLAAARKGLADELALCWIVECLSKPVISLIDGRVMGTGVGITLYNTHRVAGENYRFAMPETQIGYFPDCGVAHAFARMPHGLGFYLGLTGREIGRADALALKLVTHCIPAARFAEIAEHLAAADTVDPVLDGRHVDPGTSPLMAEAPVIARYFQAGSLSDILARLKAASGTDKAFADAALALLAKRSPLALAVTDRMIREAARLDIRGALMLDYRLAHRFADQPDFREGVRAFLIEKDGHPCWIPPTIEDVTPAMLAAIFAPVGADELVLPTRQEMQAARL